MKKQGEMERIQMKAKFSLVIGLLCIFIGLVNLYFGKIIWGIILIIVGIMNLVINYVENRSVKK